MTYTGLSCNDSWYPSCTTIYTVTAVVWTKLMSCIVNKKIILKIKKE